MKINLNELIGHKFGKIKIIEFNYSKKNRIIVWGECECGNKKFFNFYKLKYGKTKSCGCLKRTPKIHTNDFIDKKFGNLFITKDLGTNKKLQYSRRVLAKCDCGNIREYNLNSILYGRTSSCGCQRIKTIKTNALKSANNLINKKFGRLTIVEVIPNLENTSGGLRVLCKCDCNNNIRKYRLASIKSGATRSCGCLIKDTRKRGRECGKFKHGLCNHPLYRVHKHMIERCYNAKLKAYKDYGARGIDVCDRWLNKENGFINFYNDTIQFYKPGLEIDRINNDKGYSPENCRLVTPLIQARNKRNNTRITYNNQTKTLPEWADIFNIKHETLRQRIKMGWDINKALIKPVRKTSRKF